MKEIEVGEYVRTKDGYIGKLIEINTKAWNYLTIDVQNEVRRDYIYPPNYIYLKNENIKRHDKNIIDLIEVRRYAPYRRCSSRRYSLYNDRKIFKANKRRYK